MAENEPEDREIPAARAAELLAGGGAQVVDVREEAEHVAGHIPGDVHLPLETLGERAGVLDRSRQVVFYCRSGERSAMAAEAFATSGWDAHNLRGGLLAWAEGGRPLEPEDGTVADRTGLPPP